MGITTQVIVTYTSVVAALSNRNSALSGSGTCLENILPWSSNSTLAIGVIMSHGLADASGTNLYPRSDGFVPEASAFFKDHSVAEIVECPGYNHVELHDGRGDKRTCNASGYYKPQMF